MNIIKASIAKLAEGRSLSRVEAEGSIREIMSGAATPAQIGAFLLALRVKGETVSEIAAFARVMRHFASRIEPSVDDVLVDTCGTGGDNAGTFNISTGAMLVAAGAGVLIAKHGNRSVTSKCGSADVLEALGVRVDMPPREVRQTIEEIGIGFMFAPVFHRAMRYTIEPRREIGLRTVFNVLGPLTNPAGAKAQVLGVYDHPLTEKLALVLSKLGCQRAVVVHGLDGLDEISTLGKTQIAELREGSVETYTIKPEDYGIPRASPADIAGREASSNARILLRILQGEEGPCRDIVQFNAAAAILVSHRATDMKQGLELAGDAIDSGRGLAKLRQFVEATNGDVGKLKALEDAL